MRQKCRFILTVVNFHGISNLTFSTGVSFWYNEKFVIITFPQIERTLKNQMFIFFIDTVQSLNTFIFRSKV